MAKNIYNEQNLAGVAITTFPDNEPFDIAQYGGVAVGAANGFYVRPGTSAVFQVQSNSANIATETTLSAINTKLVTGTDIGDVTINNGSGANAVNIQDGGNTITVDGTITADQGGAPWTIDLTKVAGESVQVAGGTEAKAIRVTIANDSTGLLSVDDNGGALTVDGTVTANLSATDNQVLDDIAASLAIIDDWDTADHCNVRHLNTTDDAVVIADGGNTITVDGTVTTNETVPTTIYSGIKTIASAGTQAAIASSQAAKSVTVKALSTNTGMIYVGASTVSSADGFQLAAGDTISLEIANLATVFIDVEDNNDGISYIGIN